MIGDIWPVLCLQSDAACFLALPKPDNGSGMRSANSTWHDFVIHRLRFAPTRQDWNKYGLPNCKGSPARFEPIAQFPKALSQQYDK